MRGGDKANEILRPWSRLLLTATSDEEKFAATSVAGSLSSLQGFLRDR